MVLLTIALALAPSSAAQSGDLPTRDQDYLRDAVRLSGVLGSAHGIRYVCNGQSDQYWRERMINMLDLEAPQRGPLRSAMVDTFNEHFQDTLRLYRVCDSETVAAEAEYARAGREIADRMAAYYFPDPRKQ